MFCKDLKGPNDSASEKEQGSSEKAIYILIHRVQYHLREKFKYTKLYPLLCTHKMVTVIVKCMGNIFQKGAGFHFVFIDSMTLRLHMIIHGIKRFRERLFM